MLTVALFLAAAPVGVDLTASTGIEAGLGDAYSGHTLWSTASGSVPFGLEIGAHVAERWFIGAYGHFAPTVRAPVQTGSPEVALAAYTPGPPPLHLRGGLVAQVRPWPDARVAPFVGLGVGFEALGGLRGVEGMLQLGGELKLSDAWFLGAALTGSLGGFANAATARKTYVVDGVSSPRTTTSGPWVHGWAGLALRVRFSL